jgi:hypothetical protein
MFRINSKQRSMFPPSQILSKHIPWHMQLKRLKQANARQLWAYMDRGKLCCIRGA